MKKKKKANEKNTQNSLSNRMFLVGFFLYFYFYF